MEVLDPIHGEIELNAAEVPFLTRRLINDCVPLSSWDFLSLVFLVQLTTDTCIL